MLFAGANSKVCSANSKDYIAHSKACAASCVISMDERYETLCGITKEELHRIFAQPIERLAEKYRYTADEMKQELKRRYDGYHFSMKMTDIYNHTKEQMDELTGKYYETGMFIDYKADVERPLPMIYQSGYLTIKDFDLDTESYLLDYPNNEVRRGFLALIASNYLRPQSEEVDTRLTEKYFQYTFYLLLRLLGVYCLRIEERQSQGRVDCILEMKDYVYIFEFKLDGTAAEALAQIEEKGYARPYATDPRKVVRIGVTFSTATRTVGEWAEA